MLIREILARRSMILIGPGFRRHAHRNRAVSSVLHAEIVRLDGNLLNRVRIGAEVQMPAIDVAGDVKTVEKKCIAVNALSIGARLHGKLRCEVVGNRTGKPAGTSSWICSHQNTQTLYPRSYRRETQEVPSLQRQRMQFFRLNGHL